MFFFVSDLHGRVERYRKLFSAIREESPGAVFLGGDLLPFAVHVLASMDVLHQDFVNGFLASGFHRLRKKMGSRYPRVFLILGNDDGRFEEASILSASTEGIWDYAHDRNISLGEFEVYGYSYVPPTPFSLKDWERYDVSRYVDPGCVPPDEGIHTVPVSDYEMKYATIKEDIERLTGDNDLSRAIFLFHSPPYMTNLDRAALDRKMIDHAPLDVHVGSIAIQQFIRDRQPLVSLHGHVHESSRITGQWRDLCGRTHMFNAAHDGPELALIRFDPEAPESATRDLI